MSVNIEMVGWCGLSLTISQGQCSSAETVIHLVWLTCYHCVNHWLK